ncbi:MAG: hypothetical protein JO297_04345 [Nitrososphaeraceae archaeon]|nr:hypothetical protein [Nitrososphaeraceae archaeon]
MMSANVHVCIKSIILVALLIIVTAVVAECSFCLCLFDLLNANIYNKVYAAVINESATNSTALDYAAGKNAGSIAAVHDFSALNGHTLYNPRINQGSNNYRTGYIFGYNQEWKQLLSAANSNMSTSSLQLSDQKISRDYLINGTQSLNYASIGQSLSCIDLNESSPHGAVLATILKCGSSNDENSHREGMPTTSHSFVTPTTTPYLSGANTCSDCRSKGNFLNRSGGGSISSNPSNGDAQVPSSSSSSSPIPGIIPP